MLGEARVGWISALSNDPESEWRSVEGFYKDVLSGQRRAIPRVSCKVWGRFHGMKSPPKRGDGIAFYHSTRAIFPAKDRYKKKPRISLVGELMSLNIEHGDAVHIEFAFQRRVANVLRNSPIIRDETTNYIFERCGIRPGPIASYYFVEPELWSDIWMRTIARVNVADRPASLSETMRTIEELALSVDASLIRSPEDVETTERIRDVMARVGQSTFSQSVRTAYNHQCCFPGCEIGDDDFLVGSHIARWSDVPELRGKLSNGLCLCLMHDRAFELGLFTLTQDLRINVAERARKSAWGTESLLRFAGKQIRHGQEPPSPEALRHHWVRIGRKPA